MKSNELKGAYEFPKMEFVSITPSQMICGSGDEIENGTETYESGQWNG